MANPDDDRIVPLYAVRIEDLRQRHVVKAHCGKCGREATVPHWLLKRHAPDFTRILALQHKLRCTGCGHKGSENTISVRRMRR